MVSRVFKNGKVRVSFWVQTLRMINPELWHDNVWTNILSLLVPCEYAA